MTDVGILAFGGYVPPTRVSRRAIVDANAWMNSGVAASATSERSVCGWDEDAVTLAVEAGRDCMRSAATAAPPDLVLGMATPPHLSRLNAAIVAGALGLPDSVSAVDVSGGLRAGTAALRLAVDAATGRGHPALCIASEASRVPAASAEELSSGHGSAAVLVGSRGPLVARLKGSATVTIDFVDHQRTATGEFDRPMESRWIRDEGYLKTVPKLVTDLLEQLETRPNQIDHFCLPEHGRRVAGAVARAAGLTDAALADPLWEGCGDCGAAHALMLLVRTLETAKPGQHILVASFGQGSDAFLFEVTDALPAYRAFNTGLSQSLQRRLSCSYSRYLTLQGLVVADRGPRAEAVETSSRTAAFRHRDFLLTLSGGICAACGTAQIPSSRICVNPDCGAWDSQRPHSFRNSVATVATWTADALTYSPDPPARYGMVDFSLGGRLMIDFTDIGVEGIDVGAQVRFVFRAKSLDQHGKAQTYFWKAAPFVTPEVIADA